MSNHRNAADQQRDQADAQQQPAVEESQVDESPVEPSPAKQSQFTAEAVDSILAQGAAGDVKKIADEFKQAQDRALRAQAELENFRKRARREMDDAVRYASLPLIRDLLGVLDNLERAIEAAEQSHSGEGLLQGVKMVAEQLKTVLAQRDCKPIESQGVPFDPNKHEAIAQEPSDEYKPGVITRVTQRGYQLHDRVVRPSQVLISTGPAAARDEKNDTD